MRGTSTVYFKSLNRSFNVLGVDRQLFFLIVGLCLPIAFSARLKPTMDILALGIFMLLHTLGILITRADNQMLALYRRHIHYRKYYAITSGVHANIRLVKPSVPVYQGQRGLV
ncbi:MAG: VirB3 family type IV secretion system protein [Gammaproteobacteria bacterium]